MGVEIVLSIVKIAVEIDLWRLSQNDIVKIVVEIGTIMENVVDIALPQAAKRLCGHDNFYDSHRRGAFSTSTALQELCGK